MEQLLWESINQLNVRCKELGIDSDHVHFVLDIVLYPLPKVIKKLKDHTAKKLVQESQKEWIDMRCKADLWVVFTSRRAKTASDNGGKTFKFSKKDLNRSNDSCQYATDMDTRNVKFGCLIAAVKGWQEILKVIG